MNIRPIRDIPITPVVAYLAGVIAGDGHILNAPVSDSGCRPSYRISVFNEDAAFLEVVLGMYKTLVSTSAVVRRRDRPARATSYFVVSMYDKSWYVLMTEGLGLPSGKKSSRVRIPDRVLVRSELTRQFIAGLFDTDGGRRGNSIGFCSASKELIMQVSAFLDEEGFDHFTESWVNVRTNRRYFGLRIYRGEAGRFINEMPLRHVFKRDRLLRVCRSGQTGRP